VEPHGLARRGRAERAVTGRGLIQAGRFLLASVRRRRQAALPPSPPPEGSVTYAGFGYVFNPSAATAGTTRRATGSLTLQAGELLEADAATKVAIVRDGVEIPCYTEAITGYDAGTTIPHYLDPAAADGQPLAPAARTCAAVYYEYDETAAFSDAAHPPTAMAVVVNTTRTAATLSKLGWQESDNTLTVAIDGSDARFVVTTKDTFYWSELDALPTRVPSGTQLGWWNTTAITPTGSQVMLQLYYGRLGAKAGQLYLHTGFNAEDFATHHLVGRVSFAPPDGEPFTPGTTLLTTAHAVTSYGAAAGDDAKVGINYQKVTPVSPEAAFLPSDATQLAATKFTGPCDVTVAEAAGWDTTYATGGLYDLVDWTYAYYVRKFWGLFGRIGAFDTYDYQPELIPWTLWQRTAKPVYWLIAQSWTHGKPRAYWIPSGYGSQIYWMDSLYLVPAYLATGDRRFLTYVAGAGQNAAVTGRFRYFGDQRGMSRIAENAVTMLWARVQSVDPATTTPSGVALPYVPPTTAGYSTPEELFVQVLDAFDAMFLELAAPIGTTPDAVGQNFYPWMPNGNPRNDPVAGRPAPAGGYPGACARDALNDYHPGGAHRFYMGGMWGEVHAWFHTFAAHLARPDVLASLGTSHATLKARSLAYLGDYYDAFTERPTADINETDPPWYGSRPWLNPDPGPVAPYNREGTLWDEFDWFFQYFNTDPVHGFAPTAINSNWNWDGGAFVDTGVMNIPSETTGFQRSPRQGSDGTPTCTLNGFHVIPLVWLARHETDAAKYARWFHLVYLMVTNNRFTAKSPGVGFAPVATHGGPWFGAVRNGGEAMHGSTWGLQLLRAHPKPTYATFNP
jgi:hypothetical protein